MTAAGGEKAVVSYFTPTHSAPEVACYECGNKMQATPLGKCAACVASSVDITANAQRAGELVFCSDCTRVLVPPRRWVLADRESSEMLALLAKRVDLGDPALRVVDAGFVWTEPHSRRTQLRLTVQREVSGVLLEQSFDTVFVESTQQCPQCAKAYTHHKWVANVQLRQHVEHKRSLLYVEQVLLRSTQHRLTISSIAQSREGIDLHFAAQRDAEKVVQLVQHSAPTLLTRSTQLISKDTHTGKTVQKYTYSLELAPVCRQDLVVLPKPLSRAKGGIPRLLLCYKLNSSLHFVDPNTARVTSLRADEYFRNRFGSIRSARPNELAKFFVIDVEPISPMGKFVLANATIAHEADLGEEILVRTHLGAVLQAGDTVSGYDLRTAQFNDDDFESLGDDVPEVVLVSKDRPQTTKKKVERLADQTGAEEDYVDFEVESEEEE